MVSQVADFVKITQDKPLDIRFIEYMPFGGNNWKDTKFVPYLILYTLYLFSNLIVVRYREMITNIQKQFKDFGKAEEPDGPNDTSRAYKVPGFR